MYWEKKNRESSDPYYDLIDDFDLIISSFQSQYGIRLSRELPEGMKWEEFRDLLVGIAPDTALGRIVSVSRRRPERVSGEFHTGTTSDPQRMEIETCRIYKESYNKRTDGCAA